MVKGLQRLKDYFRDDQDSFVVIGGVACEAWMTSKSLSFRLTKDVDMVLVLEVLDADFVARFWAFIKAGGYKSRQKSEKRREYYRFTKPIVDDYPETIELFSRRLEGVKLDAGQKVTPIPMSEDISSLSAILMDEDYYDLLASTRITIDGLPVINAEGLIPLKAKAWLDLKERKNRGDPIDEDSINKHKKDVFKLAATLTGSVFILKQSVKSDLQNFVDCFPLENSAEWSSIMSSMAAARMPEIKADELINVIVGHFGLIAGK